MPKISIKNELLKEMAEVNNPVGACYLSKKVGVPPATVGRQLNFLEQQGYIEKVQNKGRIISKKGKKFLDECLLTDEKKDLVNEIIVLSSAENRDTLKEVLDVRMMLEEYTARHAAINAGKEDILDLESIAFAHRYNLMNGLPGEQNDLEFHLQIASIAGNKTVEKMLKLLLNDGNAYVAFSKANKRDVQYQTKYHFDILSAIKDGDEDAAAVAMLKHLNQVLDDICQA